MLAALTSAAMPSVIVAGVSPGTTHIGGIDQAQVRDLTGKTYDVYATDDDQGRKRLAARVKAAKALAEAREPGGLGFAFDRVLAFVPGDDPKGPTGTTAVMIAMHQDGRERDLNLLTLDDCSSMGTAIGAIHRLNPLFLAKARYPIYATEQIKAQLVAWIARLKHAGHVPTEITSSWSKILETEGLWSFRTCLVHGGFEDGDVRFDGSTITAINNWQNMQVNDPARDLAWIFSKLDEDHRNAVLTAYGRMMGNRLDDLIMLRANLWVQMEQVGEFIQALNKADTQGIIRFKAQVDRLAHQLGVTSRAVDDSNAAAKARRAPGAGAGAGDPDDTADNPPSTITVGTLLKDGERRRAAAKAAEQAAARAAGVRPGDPGADATAESDRTGSAYIEAAGRIAVPTGNDDTMDAPIDAKEATIPPSFHVGGARADGQAGPTGATGSTKPQPSSPYPDMPAPSSSETITLAPIDGDDEDDDTDEHDVSAHADPDSDSDSGKADEAMPVSFPVAAAVAQGGFGTDRLMDPPQDERHDEHHRERANNTATIVIPLLEREERALRDARAGLEFDDETFDDKPTAGSSAEIPAKDDDSAAAADADENDDTADNTADDTNDAEPVVTPEAEPEQPHNFDETATPAETDEPDATGESDTTDETDNADEVTDEDEDDDTGESVTTPKA
ncbi:aminoglycoside phosphotransferase [Bifidobacterium callitrichos DSM 23973]|uniref:Aminoglycoside phosphotransferase n=1 Tax=Bifidobacterium callitrichos DSM 23973 TaxID=1437609 RepID=A0A087ABD5_9BIFI|nr:aminoglycoside phosphotransferase [Bifidobacterium callitrichos DSM 23973]